MLLITGATGRSGRWLMKKLAEEHYSLPIRCLVRPTSNRTLFSELPLNIEYVQGDLSDPAFIEQSMQGVQILIHLAGNTYSRTLVSLCQKARVEWAILIHTSGRFSKFKSASAEYLKIEDDIEKTGFNCTILWPTMIYGSSRDLNIWRMIEFMGRWKFFPVFGNGKNLMQPILDRDLGNAIAAVLLNRKQTQGKRYVLAGKNPISYSELIQTTARALKIRVLIIKLPYSICLWAAKIYGLFVREPIVTEEQVMRMQEDKNFDCGPAIKDFGFKSASFEEGIQFEAREYLQRTQSRNSVNDAVRPADSKRG